MRRTHARRAAAASASLTYFPFAADQNTKRDTGRKAQQGNIAAAKVRVCQCRTWLSRRSRAHSHHFCLLLTPACLQAVADIIRTTLGPQSMLKMILDASGVAHGSRLPCVSPQALTVSGWRPRLSSPTGIVLTNDGNAILREIDVSHPAAKARCKQQQWRAAASQSNCESATAC